MRKKNTAGPSFDDFQKGTTTLSGNKKTKPSKGDVVQTKTK